MASHEIRHAADMSARQKYRLMTSVIVPRPIAWVSTRSADGVPTLAPFSYFNAVSSDPMPRQPSSRRSTSDPMGCTRTVAPTRVAVPAERLHRSTPKS